MNSTAVSGPSRRWSHSLRLRPIHIDERSRHRLLLIGSAVGWAFLLAAAVVLIRHDGGYGYDAYAYWQAGRNVLDGSPLYWVHNEGALGAYRYPPLFAQLWAPFSLMPALAFSWAWRLVCLLALRYLAGSWRNVGLWGLVPFTWTELSVANVTFPTAALTVMALRGRSELAAWAGSVKFAPLLAVPYLWLTRAKARRTLALGLGTVLAAFTISFVISPDSWFLYVQALGWMSTSSTDSFGVFALLPNGLEDFLLRLAIALGLLAVAVWRSSDRFAFTATVLAAPVISVWNPVVLLVLPRLGRDRPATEVS